MCEHPHARQGTASDFTGTSNKGTTQTPVLQMLYLRFRKQNRLYKVMQVGVNGAGFRIQLARLLNLYISPIVL